jgi:AraC-like DNA-binding protein
MLPRKLSQNIDQELLPVRGTYAADEAPELFIGTVGVFRSRGDFYWEQVSPGMCIHIVSSGTGIFEVEGKSYEVSGGSLFVFWADQYIRYWDFPDTPWRYTWISLQGRGNPWLFREAGLSRSRPHLQLTGVSAFFQGVEDIVQTFRKGEYTRLYPYYAALELVDMIGKHASGLARFPVEPLGERVKKMIDSSHLSVPTIQGLAEILQVDRTTLYKAFKAKFGMSVKEYIDASRLEKACRLLASSDSSIKEIAFSCGYHDSRYFSRVFRNKYGCTPTAWRTDTAEFGI